MSHPDPSREYHEDLQLDQDVKKVTAAVKIKIMLDREAARGNAKAARIARLEEDLARLKMSMKSEEFTEYQRRIA